MNPWLFWLYSYRKKIFFGLLITHALLIVINKFYFLYHQKTIKQFNQEKQNFYKNKRKLLMLSSYTKIIKTESND